MAKGFNNHYTVSKVIGGEKITAQFGGLSVATRMANRIKIDGTDNTSLEKLAEYLFEYVIVEPKLSIKDFGKDKIGETVTKTIDGKEYTAKFNGLLTALRAFDESYDDEGEGTDIDKLAEYLFANVITSPKNLTIDDFETMETFKKVVRFAQETMRGGDVWKDYKDIITFAQNVMNGRFREEKDKSAVRETSKG